MHTCRTVFIMVTIMAFSLLFVPARTAQATTITVTTTSDELNTDGDCSLREAIRAANLSIAVDQCTKGTSTNTITLLSSTYTLTVSGPGENAAVSGDLDITGTVAIIGAGASATIIDGNHLDRVFHIHPGATVSLSRMTVRNGSVLGGTYGNQGGGIYNAGLLQLLNTIISGNLADGGDLIDGATDGMGGGIYNIGNLTVTDSTIYSNTASGGYQEEPDTILYRGIGGGIVNIGTLSLTRSDVASNTANIGGASITTVTP